MSLYWPGFLDDGGVTMTDRKLENVLDSITTAVKSARKCVERTNAGVEEVLESIHDPERKNSIKDEVKREISANPGFLDEVQDLIDKR
mmetsp:Transcript_10473/g.26609  ORF Transcript_10473/g.26609 Transcript_10473/m.26609 type:complete len:88 (+) Transcript_10473:120-383(+)